MLDLDALKNYRPAFDFEAESLGELRVIGLTLGIISGLSEKRLSDTRLSSDFKNISSLRDSGTLELRVKESGNLSVTPIPPS